MAFLNYQIQYNEEAQNWRMANAILTGKFVAIHQALTIREERIQSKENKYLSEEISDMTTRQGKVGRGKL